MISFRVEVVTEINQSVIPHINGQLATYERVDMPLPTKPKTPAPGGGTVPPADRLRRMYDPNGCEVGVELEEKLSGPAKTYSSVAVRVSLRAKCKQEDEAVRALTRILYDEAQKAVEAYSSSAMKLLLTSVGDRE